MKLFNIFKKKKIKNIPNKHIGEALRITNEDKPILARQEYGIHIKKNPPKNKSLLASRKYGEAAKQYKEAADYYATIANEKLKNNSENLSEEENAL